MKRLALLSLIFFASCDSCLPVSWRSTVPPFVTGAIAIHSACVQDNPCGELTDWCHRQSEARCLDAGYDKSCADAELEGSCGVNVK